MNERAGARHPVASFRGPRALSHASQALIAGTRFVNKPEHRHPTIDFTLAKRTAVTLLESQAPFPYENHLGSPW